MFAGADKDDKGRQNYSSYVEFNYPFSVKSVDLNLTCGFLPYEAGVGVYGVPNSGFAVTNVALKGITEIKITDSFSIPVFAQAHLEPSYGRCTSGIRLYFKAMIYLDITLELMN